VGFGVWLVDLAKHHVSLAAWALLVALSIGALLLWAPSRRWAALSRLHRLATRNEAQIRQDTRRQLDSALRSLGMARRDCAAHGDDQDVALILRLIRQIETARDRIASDYVPSPANAPAVGRELDLDQLQSSESIGQLCQALARQAHIGSDPLTPQLGEVESNIEQFAYRGIEIR
jgi:hypothetical protein